MTQRQYKIRLPMRLQTSSKKKTALNLNVYRNLHFRSLSALKNKFHKLSEKLLQDVPPLGRITLLYEVFPQTKRIIDIGNVCSIVDKFFSDSLTTCGVIEDDNHKYLDEVSFRYGGLSPKEHVLVTITEIEPRKGNVMRILLDNKDVQEALDDYVLNTLNLTGATGVRLYMEDDEVVAEVLMDGETIAAPKPKPKNKGGRPAGSKNKAKEPDADVEVPAQDGNGDDGTGSPELSEVEPKKTYSAKEEAPASEAKAKSEEGKERKNLFSESPEESSPETDGGSTEEGKEDSVEVAPKAAAKKSSIFDQ